MHPCEATYFACPAPAAAQDVSVPPDKPLDNGLLQGWGLVARRFTSRVTVVRQPGS